MSTKQLTLNLIKPQYEEAKNKAIQERTAQIVQQVEAELEGTETKQLINAIEAEIAQENQLEQTPEGEPQENLGEQQPQEA